MRVGLFPVPVTAEVEALRELGRRADVTSIHSLWIPEPHLLAFPSYTSVFPYAENGKMPEEYGDEGELDGLLSLAYLAAITERLRIGIGVCVVREPISLAKMVTTLDHLSGGRFDFGVGLGWLEEEFRAVGASFSDRAARCRESLELIKVLWQPERADELPEAIAGAVQEPRPIQRPHPPIHFGGNGTRALKRVASLGQGWLPWNLTPKQAGEGIEELTRLLESERRERDEVEVSVAVTESVEQVDLDGYAQAGVDQLLLVTPLMRSPDEVGVLFDRLQAAGLIDVPAGR
jgi:probable F420-dependent oxidoreductase